MVIAIDGPSASGKGTVAKILATRLDFVYLSTGDIYRGITIWFLQNDADYDDHDSCRKILEKINFRVCVEHGDTHVYLNDKDVTGELHTPEVCDNVYHVAKMPFVREKVRAIQHDTAKDTNLVCEGRDITSVVFPDARFKFYLTASVKARATRRMKQLAGKGFKHVTLESVKNTIADRDRADMTREISPLIRMPDAIVIDCTRMSAERVVKKMQRKMDKATKKGG